MKTLKLKICLFLILTVTILNIVPFYPYFHSHLKIIKNTKYQRSENHKNCHLCKLIYLFKNISIYSFHSNSKVKFLTEQRIDNKNCVFTTQNHILKKRNKSPPDKLKIIYLS